MVIAFIAAALKIIGIVLLIILALAVIVLAIVMLVPVRYELCGEKYDAIRFNGAAAWLFGLLKIKAEYGPDGKAFTVSLAGHKVYPKHKNKKGVKERGTEQVKTTEPEPKEDKPETDKKPKAQAMSKKAEPMPAVKRGDVKPQVVRVKMAEMPPEEPEKEEPKTKAQFCLDYIKAMTKEDKTKAVKAVFAFLRGLVKHVLPKEFRLYAVVGTDDPAQTGYILAAAGIARGVTGQDIVVQGDFEKERFEGEVSAKGRIRMGSLAALTIKLVFTKPIREFIFRFLKVRGELL